MRHRRQAAPTPFCSEQTFSFGSACLILACCCPTMSPAINSFKRFVRFVHLATCVSRLFDGKGERGSICQAQGSLKDLHGVHLCDSIFIFDLSNNSKTIQCGLLYCVRMALVRRGTKFEKGISSTPHWPIVGPHDRTIIVNYR